MTTNIATFTTCACGWIGIGPSHEGLIEMWYEHVGNVDRGEHYRFGGGAIGMPMPAAGVAEIVRTTRGLNELGMFRAAERRGLEMVSQRRKAEERGWLGQAEGGLRRGVISGLVALALMAVVVIGIVMAWRGR